MSRLDELIAELCPDGVEYKKLGEISTISRGGSFQKKDFTDEGVPCIHYGQIYTRYGLFVKDTISFIDPVLAKKQKMAEKNDIVMAVTSENIDDVCRCVAYFGEQPAAVSGHTAIIHHNQDAKFLVYYLHSSMFFSQKQKLAHGTKVIEVTPDRLNDVEVPVPPVEVQREIVRVLDNFTLLRQELSARRKQYEYYREKLLPFGDDVHRYMVKDICDTITNFAAAGSFADVAKNVPYLSEPSYAQLIHSYEYLWRVQLTSPCIVLPSVGNCGEVYYIDPAKLPYERNALAKNALLVRSSKVNLRFLSYLFEAYEFQNALTKITSDMGQSKFNKTDFEKLLLPIPSRKEQETIVGILDGFSKLCYDISIGIPAEIDARTKQYEFYRDKLLSYKSRKEVSCRA